MTIAQRASEIVAETGASMVAAVSQAYDELDPDRIGHLVNTARAFGEILEAGYPGQKFTVMVDGVAVDRPIYGGSRP